MKFEETVIVAASQQAVWKCLTDNTLLQQCIPGCKNIQKKPERGFITHIELRLGFVTKKLEVHMLRRGIDAPSQITFEAKAGKTHSAVAALQLEPHGEGTRIVCAAELSLGGILGKGLGGMLVNTTTKRLIDEFCDRIGKTAAALQQP